MIDFSKTYDVYVTTEVGDVSLGGISHWVDNWVRDIAPNLEVKPILVIECETHQESIQFVSQFVDVIHRPGSEWEWEYTMRRLPITNYFSLPNRKYVDKIIKNSRRLHFLSYPLPIMMYGNSQGHDVEQMRDVYPKEISSICVHSKERNTLEYQRKVRKNISDELYRYQENSIEFQELLIKDSKKSVWIGINNDKGFTHHIPNYYEFTKNLSAVESNRVGFPARSEPRKNIQFLENTSCIAFTNNIEHYDFMDIEVVDYVREYVDDFYSRDDWGISHCAFNNEPFGYGIFQSIDYGKVPILSKDWCEDIKYPFRADTLKQFEKQVARISKLSVEKRNTYLRKLRKSLLNYTDKKTWKNNLLKIYND